MGSWGDRARQGPAGQEHVESGSVGVCHVTVVVSHLQQKHNVKQEIFTDENQFTLG